MTDPVVMALARGGIVDITTKGRRTGRAHRIEISLHNLDRRLVISGRPGPRDWFANLLANPRMTIHFKRDVVADVPAMGRPVREWSERHVLIERVMNKGFGFSAERTRREIDFWVTRSPLVIVSAEWPGWFNAPEPSKP
ncbi:MAG TPA: nitroreductase/quinone reductase family protein [Acidimicrobiia bacterium]